MRSKRTYGIGLGLLSSDAGFIFRTVSLSVVGLFLSDTGGWGSRTCNHKMHMVLSSSLIDTHFSTSTPLPYRYALLIKLVYNKKISF